MEFTFENLDAMEIELLPGREALIGFINAPFGSQLNFSGAAAANIMSATSLAAAATNNTQALVQS